MELWESILIAFGGNAALLVTLGVLGRSLLGQLLTKDIESHKDRLQAESAVAIERLKADFQLAAVEHEVRFSRLHDKRARVLAELYKLLVVATWEADTLVRPFATFSGESVEQYRVAMKAISEYFRFFDQHRIYLTHDLCIALERFAKTLQAPTITFGVYIEIESPNRETIREKQKAWKEAWDSIQTDVPALRVAIEDEFRKLLGVLPL